MKRYRHTITRLATHTAVGVIAAAAALSLDVPALTAAKGAAKSLKLDHFWCYIISSQTPQAAPTVILKDQFQTVTVSVNGSPLQFCNPVQKTVEGVVTPIVDITDHLTMYNLLTAAPLPTSRTFTATNQFGATRFTVDKATTIMVPTQKNDLAFPTGLDHYLCYPINGPSVKQAASLSDQFQTKDVTVAKPVLFCNPVEKTFAGTRTRIQNATAHLVCYNFNLPQATNATDVNIVNQFEKDIFTVTATQLLCAPSTKTLVS